MLSGAGGASGSTSGSTSGGASGSRKSPKCIFVQRIWYRIVRDAFGGRKCFRKYFRKCFRKSEVARKYKRASRTLSRELVSDQSTAVEPISDQIGIGHLTSAKLGLISDQCIAEVDL